MQCFRLSWVRVLAATDKQGSQQTGRKLSANEPQWILRKCLEGPLRENTSMYLMKYSLLCRTQHGFPWMKTPSDWRKTLLKPSEVSRYPLKWQVPKCISGQVLHDCLLHIMGYVTRPCPFQWESNTFQQCSVHIFRLTLLYQLKWGQYQSRPSSRRLLRLLA